MQHRLLMGFAVGLRGLVSLGAMRLDVDGCAWSAVLGGQLDRCSWTGADVAANEIMAAS